MRTRRTIRADLTAELSLETPDLERVAELSAELERARRRRTRPERTPAAQRPVAPPAVADADAEAIKSWPPELRARLHDRALTRVIMPWRD
ncbi:hypothetical protein [Streptomyces sp. NPDC058371]|uniref:hypothetical protein n=1 Tax=Streptomyces sp. NPDC058371 TaxID=3346463 RepID=UPI0036465166